MTNRTEIKLRPAIEEIVVQLRKAISNRNDDLFMRFLPAGYEMTTLDSVEREHFDSLILAKVRIGTLITIYDDFADNPKLRDAALLKELCRLPFAPLVDISVPASSHSVVQLVGRLWSDVLSFIEKLPNHPLLADIFEFDVQQFYNANRYSELITSNPQLANQAENRAYAPHNMGIMIVGTLDLMASKTLVHAELGRIRSLFHKSQTIARIMNVLTTLGRELKEGDVTGEVVSSLLEQGGGAMEGVIENLNRERDLLFSQVMVQASAIRSFDAIKYVDGLKALHDLHQSMQGVI